MKENKKRELVLGKSSKFDIEKNSEEETSAVITEKKEKKKDEKAVRK